ncbi:MAG: polysaccharide pyruvyl transferase family protein [Spirochaetales bacterium]|nr:polysaccharide pyruvyl transferase family protein [Spirochaetales bacterium]
MTAYSIYHHLTDQGYKVLMVDKPKFWWPGFGHEKDPLARDFSDRYMTLSKCYNNHEDIRELNNLCGSFIVGSDQMWNYGLYKSAGHYTFLDFANSDKKKIAYATSFGHSSFMTKDDKELAAVSKYLKRFSGISVREETGIDILKKLFDVDAVCTLDAVFLSDFEHYNTLAGESDVDVSGKYIFAYILDGNPRKADYIKRVAAKMGIKKIVLVIDGGDVPSGKVIDMDLEITYTDTVNDWLKYLFNASFVITDSFHGCCFSIISKKQFIGIKNEGRGGTRFDSILTKAGLTNRLISEADLDSEVKIPRRISYKTVSQKLQPHIDSSKAWLKDQLHSSSDFKHVYADGSLIKSIPEENSVHGVYIYRDYRNLGLKGKVTIDQIVDAMPINSMYQQSVGRVGDLFLDVPTSYGVLKIVKTTDYFVDISFVRNTMKTKSPELYVAHRVDRKVVGWTRFVSSSEFDALGKKVEELENRVSDLED